MTIARGSRLAEIDSLRGLAALSVVLFHYTTRIGEVYGENATPSWGFPQGHYGVNLFFVISGFVIFMTLERTHRPMDFVVSRFSRLYPAYWAAVALTFLITLALGLPGKTVPVGAALANLSMVHGFFGVPHVDGVYWTLEVELLFYAWMLALYCAGALRRVHSVLSALVALQAAYVMARLTLGIDLPWKVERFLILRYIPWFTLGVCVHLLVRPRGRQDRQPSLLLGAFSLGVLALAEGRGVALLASVLSALVWGAASGRMPWLKHGLLVWLGAISYTLYLLHENIGWSVQLWLRAHGWPIDATVPVALIVSIVLASALTALIERPAMEAIRRRWARVRSPA
jgi:peptidoglycan/LPS O-acetylase OafA/YrhL